MPGCTVCGGGGTVTADGKSVKCPACKGSGTVTTSGRPSGVRR